MLISQRDKEIDYLLIKLSQVISQKQTFDLNKEGIIKDIDLLLRQGEYSKQNKKLMEIKKELEKKKTDFKKLEKLNNEIQTLRINNE